MHERLEMQIMNRRNVMPCPVQLQEGISGVRHTAGKTAVHSSLEDRTGRVDHRGGSLTSLHACSLVSLGSQVHAITRASRRL